MTRATLSLAVPLLMSLVGAGQAAPATREAPRAARSVHLSYVLPDPAKDGVVAFYGDVVVETTVPGSYFEVCGFAGGYFGIQERMDKRVGIFSVWDTGKPTDDRNAVAKEHRVTTEFAGEGVRVDRFGGEGTGGHSDFDCDWVVGRRYEFCVAAYASGGGDGKTSYDAWFRDPAGQATKGGPGWQHVATFAAPDGGKPMKGLYSFIEDFRRDTKSATESRRATFGNPWVKTADGQWHALTQARFTASSATWEAKDTIDAGIDRTRFYLQTGGETRPSRELRSVIEMTVAGGHEATGALPARGSHTFSAEGGKFLLDGKPFQIMSGEMHYSRIPPELWRDRLRRARAMGLNTVATYVFWNVHEPEPGQFDFSGPADVARFVRIAQEEGLYVLLRPGPYACAEWEFGGYPYWLLTDPELKIRANEPKFIAAAGRYLDALGKQLAPLLVSRGGPVLMVQVENEYGSYGKDRHYLEAIRDALRHAGFDGLLSTSDGPKHMVANGSVEGAVPTVNGVGWDELKSSIDAVRPDAQGPYMVGELYPGWLDNWGKPFVRVDAGGVAKNIDNLLAHGASFSIYMVHGGTTFGFMNGANNPPYSPQITSYDYDAPIAENGAITPKYRMLRELLVRHAPAGSVPEIPADNPVTTFAPVVLAQSAPLTSMLPAPVESGDPKSFEELNQAYGYVLYRTRVAEAMSGELTVEHGIRDFAVVMVDGKPVATFDRRLKEPRPIKLDLAAGAVLNILVENTGRVNYGPTIRDNRQGLTGTVSIGGTTLRNWQHFAFPMKSIEGIPLQAAESQGMPAFRRGVFSLKEPADTFLDFRGWGKGQVWVNGHNLGRFWSDVGPQQTVYAPGCWLRAGENEIVVFDLTDSGKRTVAGLAAPVLDQLQPTTRP